MSTVALFTVLLAAFRTCWTSPISSSCADDVDLACPNQPFHDLISNEGFSLLNEGMLGKHCRDIIKDIECKGKHLSMCDPKGYEEFAIATDGIKDVLKDLCNDSSQLRQVFRKHSPCIQSLSDVYEECILENANISTNDKYDYDGSDVMSSEEMIQRLCSFYEPFKSCVTKNTQTVCGNTAAELVEQVIFRAAASAYNEKCPLKTL